MTLSLCGLDPNGNRTELQVVCFDSECAFACMWSEEFEKNPSGVDYEPKDSLERQWAGASNEELLRRNVVPMAQIPAAHGIK